MPCVYLSAQSADYVTSQDGISVVGEKKSTEEQGTERNPEEKEKKLSSAAINAGTNPDGTKKSGGMNTFLVFLRMILVLAIVLAIIWIIFKLLRKSTGNSSVSEDKFLRKVASITVSPGKSVQVVTLVDRAFLIGVADGSINLISEITDPELVSAMNLYADKNGGSSKPKNFSEVLEIFMPKKKKQGARKNVFEDGMAQQALNSLKRQSDRMSKGE